MQRQSLLAAQMCTDFQQVAGGKRAHLAHQGGLFGIVARQDKAAVAAGAGRTHGEGAADAAQLAAQRQLADEFVAVDIRRMNLAGGDQDAERDRQVETGRTPWAGRPAPD